MPSHVVNGVLITDGQSGYERIYGGTLYTEQLAAGSTITGTIAEVIPDLTEAGTGTLGPRTIKFGNFSLLADHDVTTDTTAVMLSGAQSGPMLLDEFLRVLCAMPVGAKPSNGSPFGFYEGPLGLYFSNGNETVDVKIY